MNIPKQLVFFVQKIDAEIAEKFIDEICFGLTRKEAV